MAISKSLSALAFVEVAAAAVSFVSIGDWGAAGIGGYHKTNEVSVAKQLGKTAEELDAKFVINTGDNFYYCGVQNITDEQFKIDFEDVFTDESLNVPWYGILGNHDYAYDVKSQFDYKSPKNDRWQLQDYYYTKRLLLGGSQYATFFFIDSNPCIASYRASDPKGWDPCSGQYGECKDAPDKECHFNEHILAQDCSAQYAWFQKELAAVNEDDWIIVVGHHEADQINVEDFTGVMLSNKIRLYLNGHTHALKHYQIDSNTDIDFFTTGAGSMVHTHDQDVCISGSCMAEVSSHKVDEIFYKLVSGFTTHTFAEDFSTLTTKAIDTEGSVIHSFVTTKKAGAGPSPPSPPSPGPSPHRRRRPTPSPTPSPVPPSPSPPSPSPKTASCEHYGCGTHAEKNKCQCDRTCKKYSNCCSDYDETCGAARPTPSPPSPPSPSPSPPSAASCKTIGCGKFAAKYPCKCNKSCKKNGNCCSDYEATCGGGIELVV